jgi:hypothetical protein
MGIREIVLGSVVKQPIDLCMRTYERDFVREAVDFESAVLVFGAKALSHTNIRKGAAYGSCCGHAIRFLTQPQR